MATPIAHRSRRRAPSEPLAWPVLVPGSELCDADREVIVSFGVALHDLRVEQGLSRDDLVARLVQLTNAPLDIAMISSWEAGRALPPVGVAIRFDAALGVDKGAFRLLAASIHAERCRLLARQERAREATLTALAEDGRPPAGRRRKKSSRSA